MPLWNWAAIGVSLFLFVLFKKQLSTIFTRFYNAMAGPTLILNTTQFGHADLLDELEAGANEVGDKNRDGDDCDYVHDGDDGDSDDHSMSLRIDHHVSDNPLLQGR